MQTQIVDSTVYKYAEICSTPLMENATLCSFEFLPMYSSDK